MKKLFGITLIVCLSCYAAEDQFKIRNEELVHDDNYRLGDLDKLMLKRLVAEKGLDALKKEIAAHVFNYVSQPNPYIIEHVVKKDDKSDISHEAFWRIDYNFTQQVGQEFDGNRLNEKYKVDMYSGLNSYGYQDRFDYCSYISTPDKSNLGKASTVQIKTVLYHQQSVLTFLNTLKQQKGI